MKAVYALAVVLLTLPCVSAHFSAPSPPVISINAVIGDASFVDTFGVLPTADTDELLRIQTHLTYVERQLREADVSGLPAAVRLRRSRALDRLHGYQLAGEFPVNDDHPDWRRPTFISDDGSVCAVGAMLDTDLAESIAANDKYAYVPDIKNERLDAWAGLHGFTHTELATIQPRYHPVVETRFCCSGPAASRNDRAVDALFHYRQEVKETLARNADPFVACLPEGKQQVRHLSVSFRGHIRLVRKADASIDRCLTKRLKSVRLPTSCGHQFRDLEVVLTRKGAQVQIGEVTYAGHFEAGRRSRGCYPPGRGRVD